MANNKRHQNPKLKVLSFWKFGELQSELKYDILWQKDILPITQTNVKLPIERIILIDFGTRKIFKLKMENDLFDYELLIDINGNWLIKTPDKNENLWSKQENNQKINMVINSLWKCETKTNFDITIRAEFPYRPAYQVLLTILFACNVILLQSRRKKIAFQSVI